jgi:hypothetical protein
MELDLEALPGDGEKPHGDPREWREQIVKGSNWSLDFCVQLIGLAPAMVFVLRLLQAPA